MKSFCFLNRELDNLSGRTKLQLRDAKQARETSRALLLETLTPEARFKATIGDESFRVRITIKTIKSTTSSSVVAGEFSRVFNEAIELNCAEMDENDPVKAVVDIVVEKLLPPPKVKRVLEIIPYKHRAGEAVEELPGSCVELLDGLVESGKLLRQKTVEQREERGKLKVGISQAEEKLVEELKSLPAGHIKKVQLRGDGGTVEAYYLRLKPPKVPPRRKVSGDLVRKTLAQLIHERVGASPGIAQLRETLGNHELRVELASELARRLEEHETGGGARRRQQQPAVAQSRVCMSKIRQGVATARDESSQ